MDRKRALFRCFSWAEGLEAMRNLAARPPPPRPQRFKTPSSGPATDSSGIRCGPSTHFLVASVALFVLEGHEAVGPVVFVQRVRVDVEAVRLVLKAGEFAGSVDAVWAASGEL